jgi:kojibiose phosphorylase
MQRIGMDSSEAGRFREIAEKLYIPSTGPDGIIEEFDGYFRKSPDLRGINERFCKHSQAVKQPDVVLLFKLFGREYSEKIQQANWKYYMARTLHGSSLSQSGMALAAAQCGLLDESVDCFMRAARADLDCVRPDSALGVHLACYAVLWETVVFGYAGLEFRDDCIAFHPRVPRQFGSFSFNFNWHGSRFTVILSKESLTVSSVIDSSKPVMVSCGLADRRKLNPGEECCWKISSL